MFLDVHCAERSKFVKFFKMASDDILHITPRTQYYGQIDENARPHALFDICHVVLLTKCNFYLLIRVEILNFQLYSNKAI